MKQFTINLKPGRGDSPIDVEAVSYTTEGDFFVFWEKESETSMKGKPRREGRVLTVSADDVLSIKKV